MGAFALLIFFNLTGVLAVVLWQRPDSDMRKA
jgi:hypothetical protein